MCMCLARGGVVGEGGEWIRRLGLDFTNPVETGEVLDLCFVCGGVGGEWVGDLEQGLGGGEWVGGLEQGLGGGLCGVFSA